jgi:predicted DNA-binding transcriptional regulator YafY
VSTAAKPPKTRHSNRNEPKDAILRQWVMLQLIPREPGGLTTQQIRDQLAHLDPLYTVHRRTIERNLMQLMSIFPSLDFAPSAMGNRWFWEKNTVIDIPKLDAKTALMFRLAETFLTPMFPRTILNELRPHFRQAEKTLKAIGEQDYSRWPDKVRLIQNSIQLQHPDIRPEVLDVVYAALFEDQRFRARYQVRSGERKEFEISPRGLVFRDGIVYAVGTLADYTDLKHLPLHRMETATLTAIPITPLPGFNLDRYVREYFDYPLRALQVNQDHRDEIPETFKLAILLDDIPAVHLQESPLGKDQRHERHADGRMRVTATVANTERLRWWLLSYGDRMEVVGPASLREEMAATVQRMSKHYIAPRRDPNLA